MKDLDGQTVNVGKLFSSEYFFTIPNYQRPFSWDEDNFDDLINDITSAELTQQYFLGTLVLHRTGKLSNYAVVDSQQRLTSLMILLACIRDLINDESYKANIQGKLLQKESLVDGIPEKVRLEVKDREIFKQVVLTANGTKAELPKGLPEPEYRYVQAVNIFKAKLFTQTQEQLQKLIQFISQRCMFIYLATSTFDDAFRLFTIVNDRGKQLRRIDILKAENISPDVVASSSTRTRIAQKWEQLEKDIGESLFESVLHYMRFIYVKEKPQGDLLKEFDLRIFKKGLLHKGEKFVDEVFKYVNIYKSIFIEKDALEEKDPNYNKFRGLVYIMDEEFVASEWRACVLYFSYKYNNDSLYDFILALEKVYLEQWVKGVRKDERFSQYASILKLIEKHSRGTEVIKNIVYNLGEIQKACDDLDFYTAGYSKYFLLRLELLASENDVVKEYSAKSIEHVFPQNPATTSKWAKDPKFSSKQLYINTVGNLVLLSKGKNSSAGNLEFEDKKEKYLKPRVTDYPRSVQVLGYKEWTLDIIQKRNRDIKKIIVNNP